MSNTTPLRTTPLRTVIVGCGMIAAGGYQPRCQAYPNQIELVGYYDQDEARASALAERGGGKVYPSLEAVLNDPNVEAIVNLTIHISHYPVSLAALKAGKHVYSEKPISIKTDEANELVETAETMGLKIACAPSAILGYVQQNVWKRIRDGEIGNVISALGNFGGPLEHWHPNADAFLMHAGPFRDVAPYPLTAMTTMIGPVKTVHGFARVAVPKRVLTQGPRQGTEFEVAEKDHGFAVLEFDVPQAGGAQGFIYHSFTVSSQIPPYEIHCTNGGFSIQAHDDGRGIKKFTPQSGWKDEPSPSKAFTGLDWGKGVADFADAIRNDRIPRCNGAQARHVLEVCERVIESSDLGKPVDVLSRFPAPPAVGEVAPWEAS